MNALARLLQPSPPPVAAAERSMATVAADFGVIAGGDIHVVGAEVVSMTLVDGLAALAALGAWLPGLPLPRRVEWLSGFGPNVRAFGLGGGTCIPLQPPRAGQPWPAVGQCLAVGEQKDASAALVAALSGAPLKRRPRPDHRDRPDHIGPDVDAVVARILDGDIEPLRRIAPAFADDSVAVRLLDYDPRARAL